MAAAWPSRPAAPDTVAARFLGVLWFISATTGPWGAAAGGSEEPLKCEDLKVGQYICKDPKINEATQEPVNCTNYTAYVECFPAPNITCKDYGGNETHFTGNEVGFLKPIPCRNVAATSAYGGSQTRGRIGAVAAGLHHSHSDAEQSRICNLHHSSQQRQILNALSKARD